MTAGSAGVVTQALLLTLVAVLPGFFDPGSTRVFEEPKALLLRGAAVLLLAALVLRGRRALHPQGLLRHPVTVALAVLTAAIALSTALSVLPRVSIWGGYTRSHGLLTWLALVVVYVAVCGGAATPTARKRFVAAAILGGLVPSIYALAQAAGRDPIEWTWTFPGRAGSTFGNPVLLGGYLAALVPLTAGAVVAWRSRVLWAAAAGAALVLQVAALAATRSRGPALGALAGAVAGLALLAWSASRRWIAAAIVAAGLTAAAVFATTLDPSAGSGRVRLLIWESAWATVAADAGRALAGHGPETFRASTLRRQHPELARAEGSGDLPDRAHNDTLDALVTTGVIGAAALLAFYVALFWSGLVLLRRPLTREDTALVIGLLAGAAAHVVEIQLGIATVASRLLLILAAALMVSLSLHDGRVETRRAGRPRRTPLWQAAVAAAAAAVSLEVVALRPARAGRRTLEAEQRERADDREGAVQAYREAAALAPGEDRYLTGLARALMSSGRPDEAEAALAEAARLNPFDVDHPRNAARLARARAEQTEDAGERARFDRAADEAYTRATALAPASPALWIEWAAADVERGRFDRAAASLDRAAALDPHAASLWIVRAHVRAAAEDAAGALAAFDRALADDPRSVAALRGRAAMLVALERRVEAELALAALERVSPADYVARTLRERVASLR